MSQIPKSILIVGASGLVGKEITLAVLAKKAFDVKLLFRKESIEKNKELVDQFKAAGATIVEGDTTNLESLTSAAKGVDTIVSALGKDSLFSGGQVNLVHAAKAAGVKRVIPSEFGIDLAKVFSPSVLDAKKAVRTAIEEEKLDYTYITNGLFYPIIFQPMAGFDLQNHKVIIPGTGNEKVNFTHVPDLGKFVAEILLDPTTVNQSIYVKSDSTTYNEAVKVFEEVSGKKFEVQYATLEELKKNYEVDVGGAKFFDLIKITSLTTDGNSFESNRNYDVKTTTLRDYAKIIFNK